MPGSVGWLIRPIRTPAKPLLDLALPAAAGSPSPRYRYRMTVSRPSGSTRSKCRDHGRLRPPPLRWLKYKQAVAGSWCVCGSKDGFASSQTGVSSGTPSCWYGRSALSVVSHSQSLSRLRISITGKQKARSTGTTVRREADRIACQMGAATPRGTLPAAAKDLLG